MLVKIRFHKSLQRFTYGVSEHYIDSDSYIDLFLASMSIFPDLRKAARRVAFDKNVTEEFAFIVNGRVIDITEFLMRPSTTKEIVLCPVITGSNTNPWVLIGIGVLITAIVLTGGFGAFAVPAIGGIAGATTLSGIAATVALGIGISLIAAGLSILLAPKLATSDSSSRAANDSFEGFNITTSPNTVIPMHYGLIRVAGQLISGGVIQGTSVIAPSPGQLETRGRFFLAAGGAGSGAVGQENDLWTFTDSGVVRKVYLEQAVNPTGIPDADFPLGTTTTYLDSDAIVEYETKEGYDISALTGGGAIRPTGNISDVDFFNFLSRSELWLYYMYFDETTSALYVDLTDGGREFTPARRFKSLDGGVTWTRLYPTTRTYVAGVETTTTDRNPPWWQGYYGTNGTIWIAVGHKAVTDTRLWGDEPSLQYRSWSSSDCIHWTELPTSVLSTVTEYDSYEGEIFGYGNTVPGVRKFIRYFALQSVWIFVEASFADPDVSGGPVRRSLSQVFWSTNPLVGWNRPITDPGGNNPGGTYTYITGFELFSNSAVVVWELPDSLSNPLVSDNGFSYRNPMWYSSDGKNWALTGIRALTGPLGYYFNRFEFPRFAFNGATTYLMSATAYYYNPANPSVSPGLQHVILRSDTGQDWTFAAWIGDTNIYRGGDIEWDAVTKKFYLVVTHIDPDAVNYGNTFATVTTSDLYTSPDGINWTRVPAFNNYSTYAVGHLEIIKLLIKQIQWPSTVVSGVPIERPGDHHQ